MDTLEGKGRALSRCSNSEKRGLVGNSFRELLWLAILIAWTLASSVGLACATPFAALGAAAAVTLRGRDALLVGGMVWLINQCVGYTILRYPWTFNSVAWGIALGAATLLAVLAARWIYSLQRAIPSGLRRATAFAAAFLVFEAAIYAVAYFVLGGLEDFTVGIVSYIFAINAVTYLGLLVLYSLVMLKRLAPFFVAHSPSTRPAKTLF
jgi:hypothetical protein